MEMLDKILILIDEKGLDQGELERRAQLARGRISKWKKGTGEIPARDALRIARVLGVSLESIVDDSMQVTAGSTALSDELYVIQVYRDLKLSREEAVRRLAGQFKETTAEAVKERPVPRARSRRKKGEDVG